MRLTSELTGNRVEVDDACVLGAGGEGRVYGVFGAPALAAKVFDAAGHPDRDEKLRAMLANAPTTPIPNGHNSIAWPNDLLTEAPGGPVTGYLMHRVRNGRVIDDYYNPQARLEQCPLFHYEYLLVVARNLAAAVRSLHQRGYVIGDIKQSNILVMPNALVTLVDTDSFQVRNDRTGKIYRCPVGTPEYTPPELQGLSTPGLLNPQHDLFGLGTLIFQLLMEGAHPFAGVYTGADDPPPLGDRIRLGWFPHDNTESAASGISATFRRQQELKGRAPAPFVPARRALPFTILPVELRALFLRCFGNALRATASRPSAQEWQNALDRARSSLVRCAVNSQHRYGSHLHACPWCERMRTVLRGHDPYPTAQEAARRIVPPSPPFAVPPGPPSVPPLPHGWQTLRSPVRPSSRSQSGWPAYALAALGIPIVLGILSSQEAHDPPPAHSLTAAEPLGPFEWEPSGDRSLASVPPDMPPVAEPDRTSHLYPLSAVQPSLSPNANFAAVMGGLGVADLLDCSTGTVLGGIKPFDGRVPIDSLAVSQSGALFAAATTNGVVVWDRSRASTQSVLPDCGVVRSLAFSPDSKWLAAGCGRGDDLVSVVDVEGGEAARTCTGRYGEIVTSVRFSPDGARLFASTVGSADDAATLYCWEAQSGRLIWRRTQKTWSARFVISPDGNTVAIGGGDLELLDTANGDSRDYREHTGAPAGGANPLCFAPAGRLLAVGGGSSVRLCRFEGGRITDSTVPARQVTAAAFSVDGGRLTTLSSVNGLEEWDVRRHRRLRRLSLEDLAP